MKMTAAPPASTSPKPCTTRLLTSDHASARLLIPQFYPISVPHEVILVFGVGNSIYSHSHIQPAGFSTASLVAREHVCSERAHVFIPILEELPELEIIFPYNPGKFQVNDGQVVVRVHRLMSPTEPDTLRNLHFFPFDIHLKCRVPM